MHYGPIERLKHPLRSFVLRHAEGKYATPALVIVSALESIISPLPLETVLTPLVVVRPQRWIYFAAVATLSSVLGALIGYSVGYAFYDAVGSTIVSFYGLSEEFAAASKLLSENMFSATFISAFTPIPYKVFVLTAGVLQAPLSIFIGASLLGRGIRFFLFAYLTYRFGKQVAQLAFRYFTIATVVAVAILIALLVYIVL